MPVIPELDGKGALELPHDAAADNVPRRSVLAFSLGNRWYGFKVSDVKEVALASEPAEVPRTPPVLRGLVNVQGTIVALLDTHALLGMDRDRRRTAGALGRHVVLNLDGALMALEVESETLVLEVDERHIRPSTGEGSLVSATVVDGQRSISLLDTKAIARAAERAVGGGSQ